MRESQRDLRVRMRFLLPAKMRAMRLVFVSRAANMSEKLKPGKILDKVQLILDGTASSGKVVR